MALASFERFINYEITLPSHMMSTISFLLCLTSTSK